MIKELIILGLLILCVFFLYKANRSLVEGGATDVRRKRKVLVYFLVAVISFILSSILFFSDTSGTKKIEFHTLNEPKQASVDKEQKKGLNIPLWLYLIDQMERQQEGGR